MKADVASIRNEYAKMTLDENSCDENPFSQFEKWFKEAINADILEPNAMVLSSVSDSNMPSQRTVLLKGFDDTNFTFFTNYESRKGKELAANTNASILFPWYALERQIIISGITEKVSRDDSLTYFQSRPRSSQIGAHVSNQSEVLTNRSIIENKQDQFEKEFENKEIPLPENWGGYRIIPFQFEFWQGRKSRLHDRIQYVIENGKWNLTRLSP